MATGAGHHSATAWDIDKAQMRDALIDVARQGKTIAYSELHDRLGGSFPHGTRTEAFGQMLSEIAEEEDIAGRWLLSAVVVLKSRGRPGQGFFRLAKERGRDVSDEQTLATEELARVHAYWASQHEGAS